MHLAPIPTCTHLAGHLPEVSPNQVNRFLRTWHLPAHQLRELVRPLLDDFPEAFLLVDDSGQDKRYSKFIDVARRQYPGAVQGMVPGSGLVNLVHRNGPAGGLLPFDYRVCAPEDAQQTKNDHFLALFDHVVAEGTQARPLLFDGWYAGSSHLRHIHRAGQTFCTTLKSNRRVSVPEEKGYRAPDTLEPPERGWSAGVEVRRKEVPLAVKRFQLVATSGDID